MKQREILKRKPEVSDWINIVVILLFIGFAIWVARRYAFVFREIQGSDLSSSAENFKTFILSYGNIAAFVLIGLLAFQVIISVIPAALVQTVAGMIYGVPLGILLGIVGIALGTTIAFHISRLLGKRVVTLFVSKKNLDKVDHMLSGRTSSFVLLLLFILPTPKDMFPYVFGLTEIKFSKFLLISTLGRLPGMLVASYLGRQLLEGNYLLLGALIAFCLLVTVLFFVFQEKIFAFLRKEKKN
jgi:uncharacterized membrane protein YdjX (TVP38/TMEM64 family)